MFCTGFVVLSLSKNNLYVKDRAFERKNGDSGERSIWPHKELLKDNIKMRLGALITFLSEILQYHYANTSIAWHCFKV